MKYRYQKTWKPGFWSHDSDFSLQPQQEIVTVSSSMPLMAEWPAAPSLPVLLQKRSWRTIMDPSTACQRTQSCAQLYQVKPVKYCLPVSIARQNFIANFVHNTFRVRSQNTYYVFTRDGSLWTVDKAKNTHNKKMVIFNYIGGNPISHSLSN